MKNYSIKIHKRHEINVILRELPLRVYSGTSIMRLSAAAANTIKTISAGTGQIFRVCLDFADSVVKHVLPGEKNRKRLSSDGDVLYTYWRPLKEFDECTLAEMDDISLADIDYIVLE